jgi:hypothetical protein
VSNPLRDPRWARRVTDLLERGVGTVRDVATRPVAIVVRAVVFSLVVGTGVVVATVLLLVAIARGVHELLDVWLAREDAVWVGYLGLAAAFVLLGAALLRRRHGDDD